MSHHKRSRIGKLPRWQKIATHLIFAVCAFSGTLFFLKHEWHFNLLGQEAHSFLVTHGVSAAFVLLAFGAVLPGHIRAAWNAKRNRVSGLVMILVMSTLMLSGLLLYYGDEELRDGVLWTHWVIGFSAFAIFLIHLVAGKTGSPKITQS